MMKISTLAFLAAATAALPVMAQVMPAYTIDMTAPLHDADGKPLKDPINNTATHQENGKLVLDDPSCEKCPVMTVGDLVARALFTVPGSDDPHAKADPGQLWSRGVLAQRIRTDKAAVLTADEATQIKELLARGFPSPLLIMQLFPLLDPNAKPGNIKKP